MNEKLLVLVEYFRTGKFDSFIAALLVPNAHLSIEAFVSPS
jgi:hypothetical protein